MDAAWLHQSEAFADTAAATPPFDCGGAAAAAAKRPAAAPPPPCEGGGKRRRLTLGEMMARCRQRQAREHRGRAAAPPAAARPQAAPPQAARGARLMTAAQLQQHAVAQLQLQQQAPPPAAGAAGEPWRALQPPRLPFLPTMAPQAPSSGPDASRPCAGAGAPQWRPRLPCKAAPAPAAGAQLPDLHPRACGARPSSPPWSRNCSLQTAGSASSDDASDSVALLAAARGGGGAALEASTGCVPDAWAHAWAWGARAEPARGHAPAAAPAAPRFDADALLNSMLAQADAARGAPPPAAPHAACAPRCGAACDADDDFLFLIDSISHEHFGEDFCAAGL
ncbi:MAG: hypothetical protein J3K34DRAFT_524739 [Monoraphidium minutum]|nr:MAG: hypothetical protein J3K34DRAFT_524739 [Monoraphidium minutum]